MYLQRVNLLQAISYYWTFHCQRLWKVIDVSGYSSQFTKCCRRSGVTIDNSLVSVQGLDIAVTKLRQGEWVHIFPEGGRSRDGGRSIGNLKRGIGRCAWPNFKQWMIHQEGVHWELSREIDQSIPSQLLRSKNDHQKNSRAICWV